jgi:hypothetical protein
VSEKWLKSSLFTEIVGKSFWHIPTDKLPLRINDILWFVDYRIEIPKSESEDVVNLIIERSRFLKKVVVDNSVKCIRAITLIGNVLRVETVAGDVVSVVRIEFPIDDDLFEKLEIVAKDIVDLREYFLEKGLKLNDELLSEWVKDENFEKCMEYVVEEVFYD